MLRGNLGSIFEYIQRGTQPIRHRRLLLRTGRLQLPAASQINLTGPVSTENVRCGTGYMIERCQGSGCNNFAQMDLDIHVVFRYGAVAGTSFSYRVRATGWRKNLSAYSNRPSDVTGTPPTAADESDSSGRRPLRST